MNGSMKSWCVLAMMLALVAGCGGAGSTPVAAPVATSVPGETAAPSPAATPVGSPAATPEPTPGKTSLKAYFLLFGNVDGPTPLVPVHREVEGTLAVARAAMDHLLAGPTDDEHAHDLRVGTIGSQIPDGTRLLGLDVADGVATVDLSGEFASGDIDGEERESWAIRLAQVTFTLTQFPTVESVRFLVDGQPGNAIEGHEGSPIDLATRSAYTDQLGGIFVDDPAWGGGLTDPLIVSGIAQSSDLSPEFHAALVSRTTDETLVEQTVRAGCDAGCWQPPGGGPFEFQMSVPGGPDRDDLMLVVWEVSEDSGQSDSQAYPLR